MVREWYKSSCHIPFFPKKGLHLPSWYFFLDLFPKVLHAQFLWRTHQLWQLAKSLPSTSATLVHHHPTSRIGQNALFTKKATNSLKPKVHVTSSTHSHFFPPCIYYVRNLDETPRVNLFISIYLWCDQVVSGLLANKFLVPSFENSSGKWWRVAQHCLILCLLSTFFNSINLLSLFL